MKITDSETSIRSFTLSHSLCSFTRSKATSIQHYLRVRVSVLLYRVCSVNQLLLQNKSFNLGKQYCACLIKVNSCRDSLLFLQISPGSVWGVNQLVKVHIQKCIGCNFKLNFKHTQLPTHGGISNKDLSTRRKWKASSCVRTTETSSQFVFR